MEGKVWILVWILWGYFLDHHKGITLNQFAEISFLERSPCCLGTTVWGHLGTPLRLFQLYFVERTLDKRYEVFNVKIVRVPVSLQVNVIFYFSTVKLELEKKNLFEEKKSLAYKNIGVSYEEFFEQNIDSYEILAKDFL